MRKSKMEVQLSKDIRTYTEKVLWGLDFRQLVFGGIGLVLGVGIYVLVSVVGSLPMVLGIILGFGVMLVPFLIGFYPWKGQPFEILVLAWVRMYLMTPRCLFNRPDNTYLKLSSAAEKRKTEDSKRKRKSQK